MRKNRLILFAVASLMLLALAVCFPIAMAAGQTSEPGVGTQLDQTLQATTQVVGATNAGKVPSGLTQVATAVHAVAPAIDNPDPTKGPIGQAGDLAGAVAGSGVVPPPYNLYLGIFAIFAALVDRIWANHKHAQTVQAVANSK